MLGCVVGLLSVDRGGVSSGGLSGESCVVLLGGVSGAWGLVIQRCSKQTFAMKPLALQGTEVRSTKGRFIKAALFGGANPSQTYIQCNHACR